MYAHKVLTIPKKHRIIIAVSAPLIAVVVFLLRDWLVSMVVRYGSCYFNLLTGYYCCGCGNTRSVNALLHGNIMLSLRNNIAIPFLALVLAGLYIENMFCIFGGEVRIIPRKWQVWTAVGVLFGIYYIARNFIPAIAPV